MRIRADRVFLRELTPADCSAEYVAWLADPEVTQYLETRHMVHDQSRVREFVGRMAASADEFLFGIFLVDGGRHVGNIKVGPIRREHGLADVSLLLGAREVWGHGMATEAIGAVSRHAFTSLGVSKLGASMYAPNVGSRRAFLKAGYREEGLRRAHYELDGIRCDLVELGLLPSDLEPG